MISKGKRFYLAAAMGCALVSVFTLEEGPAGVQLGAGVRAEACGEDCNGKCRRTRVNVRKCCKKAWAICSGDCRDNVPYTDQGCVNGCNQRVQACHARARDAELKRARDAAEQKRIRDAQAEAARRAAAAAQTAGRLSGAAQQARNEALSKLDALRNRALSGDAAAIEAAARAVKAAAARARDASSQANAACR